ncbi:ferritin [Candidatus Bipolaricaulota bacterium]|nr:ferritin [Candidatus Bipolaricaulota bacterium]
MIKKPIERAFNEQIKHELESAYLYLAMSAYFVGQALDGMAQWMRVQAQEELAHAMRFFDSIHDRGGTVDLAALEVLEKTWGSPLSAFEAAFAHEQFITGKIGELVDLARREKDHAADLFLQWFVGEQIEEEASVSKVVDLLKRVGDSPQGLILADRELGARSAPTNPGSGGGE